MRNQKAIPLIGGPHDGESVGWSGPMILMCRVDEEQRRERLNRALLGTGEDFVDGVYSDRKVIRSTYHLDGIYTGDGDDPFLYYRYNMTSREEAMEMMIDWYLRKNEKQGGNDVSSV